MKPSKQFSFRSVAWRRLALFLASTLMISIAFALSFFTFYQWEQIRGSLNPSYFFLNWGLMVGCISVFMIVFRCYDRLWWYEGGKDYLLQFAAVALGFLLYFFPNRLLVPLTFLAGKTYPNRVILFAMMLSLVFIWVLQFSVVMYRQMVQIRFNQRKAGNAVLIVGAGDAGVMLLGDILRDTENPYIVKGFLDDDPSKRNSVIQGTPVLGSIEQAGRFVRELDIKEIIVAIPSATDEQRRKILDICLKTGCHVRLLPKMVKMLDSGVRSKVRDVSPEDLLGRDVVTFENPDVYAFLSGKTVMVTGGGGSIGSELSRQVAGQKPKRLIIVDIYENNAYDIQQELLHDYPELDLRVEIASVRDTDKVDFLFRKYHPQIVFHAAAHKHVPLMEGCPEEAIKNNVFGTYHVARAADTYGAEKFILISTDKAVNPTNVMGASKRLCEMVIQGMQGSEHTKYVAVRFGNVLGSNGSVIPLFKRQLAQGGPLTVTDRRIIRYFMTIPEAAQLVMQAGAIADRSQVFVLDMGEPVKILSLAENLIRLAGYVPYQDIDIVETHLRPGEKLYEELLMKSEHLTATKNEKIFVEEQPPIDPEQMERDLGRLRAVLDTESPDAIVALMKELVPTYKSPEEINGSFTTKL